ncbi:protoheme IX farnesyltransferase [Alsobacter metallidurans]|uniref:Protoheme IX farnesyltransferase n=1 Tax=Alsobacter metallidurans TaxID=340221 RepID=A0A917I5C3_9HYPH|nr:heme o synthase [Alsobacter metallidurans]GGH12050.1 protoheme IX farnesyltransferase [Alsobacter metallidurans]
MSAVSDSIVQDSIGQSQSGLSNGTAGDFFALLKPRVMSLVVFTALVGMMLAPHVNPVIGFAALLAIAVGAGASGCLNMWYDADIDALMRRTVKRPIPAGKVTRDEALGFGLTLSIGSVVTLGLITNWVAAGLLAFTIFFYVVIYSMWLKRATAQNIVIGGAAGAFPPMIGYAAVTGTVSIETVVLFAIIFLWTPPHFWALALVKSDDYRRAGIPMLPVVAGDDHTRLQILIYTLIVVPVAMLPYAMGFAGLPYAVTASVTGVMMLVLAWRIFTRREGEAARKAAFGMFGFSILYLFLLYAVLLAEFMVGHDRVAALGAFAARFLTGAAS